MMRAVNQPSVPRLDRTNPLTRGLVFCAVPYGQTFIDLVTGELGTRTGALTQNRYPAGFAVPSTIGATSVAAAGATTDQVVWPVSLARGGSLNATATLLALATTTQQADGNIYPIGGNSEDVSLGHGFTLGIDSFQQAGRGNILRLNYLDVLGISSEAGGVGTDFDQAYHFFGYACSSNGAAGEFFARGTSTTWSGESTNGTITTNRRAIILNTYNGSTAYAKRGSVALFLMYDRRMPLAEYQALYANPWQIFQALPRRTWMVGVAAGGVNITPGVGVLTATGHVPSVSASVSVSPGLGTLTLVGHTPTLGVGVTPGVGTLTVTGHAPTLDTGIRPGVGALALTGYEPTLTLTLPAPAPGVLVLTGHQPTVSVGANVSTGVGTLTVTGFAPALDLGIRPDVGTLSLAGAVPALSTGITPDASALLVTGHAPTIAASANSNVTPDAGVLSVTGFAPSLGLGITTGIGALVLNGHAPTLGDEINITTQAGVLEAVGHAPMLGLAITPAAGVLALAGHAPVLGAGISPDAGQIVVAGHTPTVAATANITINPLTGALVVTGFEPTAVATGQPLTGELVLTGHAPTVTLSGEDIATDPKLIARRPNVRVDFGTRKKTPVPTPAPAEITNMPGHPSVPRPLAGGLLAALGSLPPAAPKAAPVPVKTPAPTAAPTAAPAPLPLPTAAPAVAPIYAPLPAASAPVPVPVPVTAGITPEQMTALLQRMDALSEGVSSRLVEVNKGLQADIERVTQLLEAERDARLAREKRELNEARAKEITARLLGGNG